MATLHDVMDHNRKARLAGPMKKHELDHLRVYESDNKGHSVDHHESPGDYSATEHHVFQHAGMPKPILPAGHVLHHIAKHMNIPHEVHSHERGMAEAEETEEGEV